MTSTFICPCGGNILSELELSDLEYSSFTAPPLEDLSPDEIVSKY